MEEERFLCIGCGGWNVVAVTTDDGYACQKCFAEEYEGQEVSSFIRGLYDGTPENLPRLNSMPDKELLWSGDFPGHTSMITVAEEIAEAAKDAGLDGGDTIYPIVDHGYQFGVSLAVYH